MPETPEYNRYYSANGGVGNWIGGYVAGVEYDTFTYGVFPNEAHKNNVPCSVCYVNNRPSVIMIPAKRNCVTGWTKEYEGIFSNIIYKVDCVVHVL